MIEVGDLVRIKNSPDQPPRHPNYIGKLAIVVVKGTWSADIHILDTGNEPRIHLDNLEKL
jgi:hypothetical protein